MAAGRLTDIFQRFDKDGNGTIEEVELRRVLGCLGFPQEKVGRLRKRT